MANKGYTLRDGVSGKLGYEIVDSRYIFGTPTPPALTLVWHENGTPTAGTNYETYLAGLGGGANALNTEGWVRSLTSTTNARYYRTFVGVWYNQGSNGSNRAVFYDIPTTQAQNGFRWQIKFIGAGSGTNGSISQNYIRIMEGATDLVVLNIAEDLSTSNTNVPGNRSMLLYTRNTTNTALQVTSAWGNYTVGVTYDVTLELTNDGQLTWYNDATLRYQSAVGDFSYLLGRADTLRVGANGENATPSRFGNSQSAGWGDDRISIYK